FLTLFMPPIVCAEDEARVLRFPTIHHETVVFTYAGDLYTVPAAGSVARKLTNNAGYERCAHFCRNGTMLPLTGQYEGNAEANLMAAEGGVPKRLTFTGTAAMDDVSSGAGPNNIVMGWKNNDEIIFRSRTRDMNNLSGQLFVVPVRGGMPTQIPVPRGGFCS